MNKDVVMMLALELDLPDLLNLCLTDKTFNKQVCENEDFWMQKIQLDFPHVENPKRIAKTYKEAYEILHKTYINVYVKIVDADQNNDDEVEINVGVELSFPSTWNAETIVKQGLEEFFQRISLYGYYDVYLDDDSVCPAAKSLSYCFESIDENTEEITVVFSSVEPIYQTDEQEYQRYLDESFTEYLA